MIAVRTSALLALPALVVLLVWAALPPALTGGTPAPGVASCQGLRPLTAAGANDLLRRLGPLPAASATVADVPRRAPTRLPHDWADALAEPKARKAAFVRVLLPLVLSANEAILADRRRLAAIADRGGPASEADARWLQALADRYDTAPGDLATLQRRVDVVPVSLAIAQAAIESGWGSSRFAREGNALFGQWTWNAAAAIKPRAQRDGLGNYGIRRFDSLAASVRHYMDNLNRHHAYRSFRDTRAALRAEGKAPNGLTLAPTIALYSEKRAEYVALVRTVIRRNRLTELAAARLESPCASVAADARDKLVSRPG